MVKVYLLAGAFVLFCSLGLFLLLSVENEGAKKTKFMAKAFARTYEILAMWAVESGRTVKSWEIWVWVLASLFLMVLGFVVPGVFLSNIPMALVVSPILGAVPWFVLNVIGRRTQKNLQSHMEHAMGLVTNSYLRAQDIIGAISDNMGEFRGYTELLFKEFLTQVSLTDSSIASSLETMRDKTTNTYFKQWCTVLIQCMEDRELRFILPSIVAEMADSRGVIMEADTLVKKAQRDYIVILIIACMQIPIIGQINPDWHRMLTATTVGQVLTSVIFGVMAICTVEVFRAASKGQGGKTR